MESKSTYNVRIQIGNDSEKTGESTQCARGSIEQVIGQLKLDVAHKERIQNLKSGELDREDLDVVPFYRPSEWDSREQYDEIVGNPLVAPDPEGI